MYESTIEFQAAEHLFLSMTKQRPTTMNANVRGLGYSTARISVCVKFLLTQKNAFFIQQHVSPDRRHAQERETTLCEGYSLFGGEAKTSNSRLIHRSSRYAKQSSYHGGGDGP